ncbi:MAG: class I SAM-dependent methyltransferase [Deltaproteobacteria bacterium]|nr:class I SAM-dependent methyltransferase [Deltaproteobacteria bacterium]
MSASFDGAASRALLADAALQETLRAIADGRASDDAAGRARLTAWGLVDAGGATRFGRSIAYNLMEYRTQITRGAARDLVDLLRLTPDARVLDIACGAGQTLAAFAPAHPRLVVGLEIDPGAMAIFNAVCAQAGLPRCLGIRGDAQQLPFPAGSFDRVLCRGGLAFVRVPVALTEIARVTAPGGLVYLHLSDGWFFLRKLLRGQLENGGAPLALLNGALLAATGRQIVVGRSRTMNFQTVGGITRRLDRLGFDVLQVIRTPGNPLTTERLQPKILARKRPTTG